MRFLISAVPLYLGKRLGAIVPKLVVVQVQEGERLVLLQALGQLGRAQRRDSVAGQPSAGLGIKGLGL